MGYVMKRIISIVLATLIVLGTLNAIHETNNSNHFKRLKSIELKNTQKELDELEKSYNELHNNLKLNEQKRLEEVKRLEDEKKKLESELQAKAQIKSTKQIAYAASAFSGNKESWLLASGIPQSEWWAVDSIVSRESSWNPNAVNSESGACGLGQQLPCGKWAGAWNDPVAALKAQYQYVSSRYGGYPQAVAFWNSNHWY